MSTPPEFPIKTAENAGRSAPWTHSSPQWPGDRRLDHPTTLAESARGATELDDRTWIARVQAGDEDAAQALVRRLYPTVIKLVRCHLPRRSCEEDLVQRIFAKIFHRLAQFSQGPAPLEHWVSRIAINTCRTQFRYEISRPELRLADLSEEEELVVQRQASTQPHPINSCEFAEGELLQRLLACLKPDERLVVTLLHLEERSTQEISRLAGWSVSRVKVKAFRARHKMRKFWKTLAA